MGMGASISVCQSLSSVKVKHGGNKIGPEPQRIFGSPLDVVIKDTTHQSVPLVVQHTVEYLEEFGLNHKGLFRISGSVAKIRMLRLKYDQGEEVDLVKEGDINSVAGLLKLFLNQLPTAVFPENLCTDIWATFEVNKNCTTEQTRCLKRLLNSLPEAHSCLAHFLIRFLAKVGANSDVNQMTLENLAIVFGPTLFRIPCSPLAYEKQALCNAMLLHMLQHHKDLFWRAPTTISPQRKSSSRFSILSRYLKSSHNQQRKMNLHQGCPELSGAFHPCGGNVAFLIFQLTAPGKQGQFEVAICNALILFWGKFVNFQVKHPLF